MDPVGRDPFDSTDPLSFYVFLRWLPPVGLNHNAPMIPDMCVRLMSDSFSAYLRMIACQYIRLFQAIHVSAIIDVRSMSGYLYLCVI